MQAKFCNLLPSDQQQAPVWGCCLICGRGIYTPDLDLCWECERRITDGKDSLEEDRLRSEFHW